MEPASLVTDPLAYYTAKAFRTLMQEEGLDDSALPGDFYRYIFKNGDIVPSEVWQYFATKSRPEQGRLVFILIHLIWAHYVKQMTIFPPGCEFIVAPPNMQGITTTRRMVETLDRLCLPRLGLDGCRSTSFRGRTTYPEVEEAQNHSRQHVVSRYGLYNFDRLVAWVMRLDELYGPYQPGIVHNFTTPKIAEIIALQLHDLNSDIFN